MIPTWLLVGAASAVETQVFFPVYAPGFSLAVPEGLERLRRCVDGGGRAARRRGPATARLPRRSTGVGRRSLRSAVSRGALLRLSGLAWRLELVRTLEQRDGSPLVEIWRAEEPTGRLSPLLQ